MPDHPSEPDRSAADVARPDASAERRAAARSSRRGCPRCGAPLGALSADGGDGAAESLYCGCCGLVIPAGSAAPAPPAA